MLPKLIKRIIYSVFSKFPKKNYIIFESHRGLNASCNPRAIYSEAKKIDNVKCVWSVRKEYFAPLDSVPVKRGGILYVYYLSRAKIWIQNGEFSKHFKKPKGTIYINTQHGVPLKSIGSDISAKKNKNIRLRSWDILLSQNKYMTEILKKAFLLKDNIRIIENNYPRNDIFYQPINKLNLKNKFNLPLDKKIILYAPTYRDYYRKFNYYTFFEDIPPHILDQFIFIVRGHHLSGAKKLVPLNVYNFSGSKFDPQELCLISDMLITDYSSIMFDFLHQKKLIIHYFIDYDLYKDFRGLYFDVRNNPLGPIINRPSEISSILENADKIKIENKNIIERNFDFFCGLHNHQSAKYISSIIKSEIDNKELTSDYFLNLLYLLKRIKKRHSDWSKHDILPALMRQPRLLPYILKIKKDRRSWYILNKITKNKKKMLILGNAENLNLISEKKLTQLREDHLIVGLNRASISFRTDITLWADNLALTDIAKNKRLSNSSWYIKVGCNTLDKKIIGSKYWSQYKNLSSWKHNRFFMSRTILTSAFYIAFKLKIYDIKFIGVDLETRNYFRSDHVLQNKNQSYELINDYYIIKHHNGYTNQRIVKEIIEYLIREKFEITSFYKNNFLSSIEGLKFDLNFLSDDIF